VAIEEVTPQELKQMMDSNADLFVLDVREDKEIAVCAIEGTVKIPLGEMGERYAEVPKDKDVVVHCKLGGRSAKAVELLQSKGYTNVKNLTGGIIRWINDVDATLSKY